MDPSATTALEELDAATLRALVLEGQTRLAERDARLVAVEQELSGLTLRHQQLWNTYERLKEALALLQRRIFVAKAERVDTTQLQLEFEELNEQLNKLSGQLEGTEEDGAEEGGVEEDGDKPDSGSTKPGNKPNGTGSKPKGRRGPADLSMSPKETVRISDPVMDALVAEGKAKVVDVERTSQLGYQRGGYRHVVTERVKYVTTNAHGLSEMETAAMPKSLLPRCLATASTLAHIITSKFCYGLPLYRIEEMMANEGIKLDRGTMSRWVDQLGGTFGATVVEAMDQDARANAFCMLTDATGFAIQPGRRDAPGPRRPCRKGHFFVRIADQDHVLFDFMPKHTKEGVYALFRGYEGYVQADASSVYDALFRTPEERKRDDPEHDGCERIEVGCWSHARRKYWEAALAKSPVARAALLRIGKMFEIDEKLRKGKPPPDNLARKRQTHLRPLVDEFLEFAEAEYAAIKNQRSSLTSALGYTVRNKDALRAFLRDGRLRMDNNPSEGQLRKVVRIRDVAFFAGSDEHAESAASHLTLIASSKLHDLDPQAYLRDIIRVLPFWPMDRYLELAPKFWAETRARLDPVQLEAEVGHIDVPPRAPTRTPDAGE